MKAWDERTPEQQIALLKSLIKHEGRRSMTTPLRFGLDYEDVLPPIPGLRRSMVQIPSRRGNVSIPCVQADRRAALRSMEALLQELENDSQ